MKPGNRRNEHGANSCGDIMSLRDERGYDCFHKHRTSSHAEGVFFILLRLLITTSLGA